MASVKQPPPPQPKELDRVQLHRKKAPLHPLEVKVARALAHDMDRCVVAVERTTVTLHEPLQNRAEQVLLSASFLDLTSNDWWQHAVKATGPGRTAKARWTVWEELAEKWLAARRKGH